MTPATEEDVVDILGDRVDETVIERIVNVGASIAEIQEAIDDFEHQARFGEERESASAAIQSIREILEETITVDVTADDDGDDEHEGLSVVDADDLVGEERA